MAAAGVAAGAALEVIGRGEDKVRPFEVVVLRFECGRRLGCGRGRIPIHASILSRAAGACGRQPEAMGKIEA